MLAANEKDETIFAEHGEEAFEFGDPSQLDDGRVVSNVRNNSHEEPGEHVYPLFFEVQNESVEAVECGCPADEYHAGPCKHRQTAEQSTELRRRVRAVTSEQRAADGGVPVEDIERVVDADCVEWDVVENNPEIVWLKRADDGFKEDLWFTDPDKFHDAVAASEFIPIDSEGDQ